MTRTEWKLITEVHPRAERPVILSGLVVLGRRRNSRGDHRHWFGLPSGHGPLVPPFLISIHTWALSRRLYLMRAFFFFHFQSARVNHSNQVPARSEVWFYAWDLYQRSELENYTQSRSFVFFSETHLAFCSFFLTLGKTGAAPQMLFCLLLSTRLNREQYNPVFSQLTRCISKPRLPRFPSKDGKTII